jgi:predicted ATP-dependent serine protease
MSEQLAMPSKARAGGFAGVRSGTVEDLAAVPADRAPRRPSGLGELDRVLGGGIVAGSVVLIGGDPGIGKSTLLLQVLVAQVRTAKVLYVSGEESLGQIAARASRLDGSVEGVPGRDRCRGDPGHRGTGAAAAAGHRLDPDLLHERAHRGARVGLAGA